MNYIICGTICAGKDEVGLMLPGIRLSFAQDLKLACSLLQFKHIDDCYRLMLELFNGNAPENMRKKLIEFSNYPDDGGKNRVLLQDFGTNFARKHYPDVWINSVRRKIKPDREYVITDCRFVNELMAFKDFHSIYIDAPLEMRKERALKRDGVIKDEHFTHQAEIEIPLLATMCNTVIDNSETLCELKDKVKIMQDYIKWSKVN